MGPAFLATSMGSLPGEEKPGSVSKSPVEATPGGTHPGSLPYLLVKRACILPQPALPSPRGMTRGHQQGAACMLRALAPVFQVRYLKIIEKSGYQALPWVRYITQNGGACGSPMGWGWGC